MHPSVASLSQCKIRGLGVKYIGPSADKERSASG